MCYSLNYLAYVYICAFDAKSASWRNRLAKFATHIYKCLYPVFVSQGARKLIACMLACFQASCARVLCFLHVCLAALKPAFETRF